MLQGSRLAGFTRLLCLLRLVLLFRPLLQQQQRQPIRRLQARLLQDKPPRSPNPPRTTGITTPCAPTTTTTTTTTSQCPISVTTGICKQPHQPQQARLRQTRQPRRRHRAPDPNLQRPRSGPQKRLPLQAVYGRR